MRRREIFISVYKWNAKNAVYFTIIADTNKPKILFPTYAHSEIVWTCNIDVSNISFVFPMAESLCGQGHPDPCLCNTCEYLKT